MFAYPAFVRLWLADTAKWLGLFTSNLALQLLLIDHLGANQSDLGLVRSAQWLPALLLGMVAGVLVDRVRRRPVIIAGDTICAVVFATIGSLALLDLLTVPMVAGLVLVSGTASAASMAAHQSLLPRLVPLRLLPSAASRLEQAMTAAESVGPLLAGTLVRLLSAPVAVLVNAVSYAASALLVSTIRGAEPAPERSPDRHLGRELREGARWVYRHRTLGPYAVALHTWFFFNSSVMTILVFYASEEIGLGAVAIGAVLACSGVTGVLAAGLTPRLAERWGLGRVCVLADWLTPVAFLLALLAPVGAGGLAVLMAGQLVYGTANGLKGPLELSYRNAVTPDRLRARMNATIRSVNWGLITVSAPLAGWFAATYGNRPTIAAGVAGLFLAAALLTLSPFRSVRMPDETA